jgi:hypothetical protein
VSNEPSDLTDPTGYFPQDRIDWEREYEKRFKYYAGKWPDRDTWIADQIRQHEKKKAGFGGFKRKDGSIDIPSGPIFTPPKGKDVSPNPTDGGYQSATVIALPIAGGLAVADGPLPIGDGIAIILLASAAVLDIYLAHARSRERDNWISERARRMARGGDLDALREALRQLEAELREAGRYSAEEFRQAEKFLGLRGNSRGRGQGRPRGHDIFVPLPIEDERKDKKLK